MSDKLFHSQLRLLMKFLYPMKELKRRLTALEGGSKSGHSLPLCAPVLLITNDDDPAEVLAAHEAVHGKSGKEPFFVRLIGVKPGEARNAA